MKIRLSRENHLSPLSVLLVLIKYDLTCDLSLALYRPLAKSKLIIEYLSIAAMAAAASISRSSYQAVCIVERISLAARKRARARAARQIVDGFRHQAEKRHRRASVFKPQNHQHHPA